MCRVDILPTALQTPLWKGGIVWVGGVSPEKRALFVYTSGRVRYTWLLLCRTNAQRSSLAGRPDPA